MKSSASVRNSEPQTLPEIGTAWLLLSHASWLVAAIATIALATSILVFADEKWQQLSIGWCMAGLLILIWTVYAVVQTWNASKKYPNPVFHEAGFITLLIIIVILIGIVIWSLITAVIATT
jgi:hypothetical protein